MVSALMHEQNILDATNQQRISWENEVQVCLYTTYFKVAKFNNILNLVI